MESFYRTHQYLLANINAPVRRMLMDEIDWSHRLIGIKGSRGVGKTTFLLQVALEQFGTNPECLYINFNNFYFSQHTLLDFTLEFCKRGGKTLLIDQTFKYENWSTELRQCYEACPDLQIVFTASSVMRLKEENTDLQDIVTVYNLRGFSFREYINLKTGLNLPSYTLQELIDNQEKITNKLLTQVNPMEYFGKYLEHGYYPFFLEKRNFSENLLKTMNMMMEVDILFIKQIELKYLSKIRKLFYLIMQSAPITANVSQLAIDIQTSRATIMNYIKYLKDARLLNTLYAENDDYPKKPKVLYPHNTNLMHVILHEDINRLHERKTFLYNALHARHKVNAGKHSSDFCVDGTMNFKYDSQSQYRHGSRNYFAVDAPSVDHKYEVPLWLLGFLY
jgi:predicted AAA+ superfamily ATPase